ncbi:MAG: ABC transporter substrate-binding protein [Actinomycetota bacterium]
MNKHRKSRVTWLAMFTVLAMIVAACGGGGGEGSDTTEAPETTEAPDTTDPSDDGTTDTTEATSTEPVVACELAYYTGEFAAYGESLSNDVIFPIEEIINEDPPLGRPWELVHEDLGTVGEAQAARTCLEQHGAEILISPAHGYRTYRDFIIEWVEENDGPLMPTVHGGTIPGNLGGTAEEPIFRAQGLDEALGMSGVLYAEEIDVESLVIFATEVEGFQLAANAAEKAAEAAGIEVLARIDAPAEQPSYRAEAEQIADLNPDAVIAQAGSVESATLVKQAAEAGISLEWIGETGWIQQEFIGTLGTEPIASQEGIGYAAFSYNDDTPAWETYSEAWEEAGNTEEFGPPSDQYHFSTYDLIVHTALAVEYGGSYNASDWAPAMHEVGEPPGEECYTYSECLELIRAGEEVDYEGVTGPADYTEGGVNAVVQSYTPFLEDGSSGETVNLDPERFLELLTDIAVEAECDEDNNCDW